MKLSDHIERVHSRQELAEFVQRLKQDLLANKGEWENADLGAFLEAVAAWIEDMDGYYANAGLPFPEPPSWKTFGEILLAAKHYE